MNETTQLLTYEQAASQTGFGVRRLKFYASKKRPKALRLHTKRFGHRTVRIRPVDLAKWIESSPSNI